ncbi:GGDEF domain-containing protein [Allosphingosinicella indica]|uniref:diguanylate cyclase n=1 Tax=Allosphingosinicella indica TaxID=941907 RepID=A0A1X7GCL2_9SPHN|nr:GGDEF domain-containing protein [Allosphingosinicella indica]SMF67020.1 diguanylate cyclase [Allosphingosinicella indica]
MNIHGNIVAGIPVEDMTSEVRAAIGQLSDENALLRAALAETRERVQELERTADSDVLTPLPNRRRFLAELERAVSRANRHGTPSAVLFVDLAGLKAINDAHGHFAGDAALIHVAGLLAGLIRTTDCAARVGGDEFGLILDHLDHNSAIETAERIARCIATNPLDIGGSELALESAIGVATVLTGDTVEDVLRRADRNKARAKRDG